MPDGDNATSVNVYKDSLRTQVHTRDFPSDDPRTDIITLVEFLQGIYFTKALNWLCEVCGYDYYGGYQKEVVTDPCLLILDEIEPRSKDSDDLPPLRRLDDSILNEYVPNPHQLFIDEGIPWNIQHQFEIGYSLRDDRITIPIRDELGNLVGVKARTVLNVDSHTPKYLFLYQVPKSLLLFGLDKSYPYIKETGSVIVYESEKSVLKSFAYGYCNCVSIGGHELSYTQVLKLEKLGVDIIFAFDKDITAEQIKKEANKFVIKDRIYAIFEVKNKLMNAKEAPVDLSLDHFIKLYTEDRYKVIK